MTEKFMKYGKIILAAAVLYAVIMGYYVAVSNGLGDTPLYLQARRFLPMALIAVITTYLVGKKMEKRFFISFGLVALAWATVYPLAYKLTYAATTPFFSNHFDIVFAVYTFAGSIALACLACCFWAGTALTIGITTLQFVLLLLPLWQLGYIALYHSCVSEAGMMAVFQTTPAEAKEYLLENLGYGGLAASFILYAALWGLLYWLNKKGLQRLSIKSFVKAETIFLAVVSVGALGYSFLKALPDVGIVLVARDVHRYFSKAAQFTGEHEAVLRELEVTPSAQRFAKPSTIIMVIGESASRSYMSAYGYTIRDTTPWFKSQLHNPDFTILQNGYTSWGQTVPALERALTNKSQYNEIEFNKSITVLDIAKRAGYKTYWLSNQTTIDVADTPITLVGKTADVAVWTNESTTDVHYDGTLLKYLDKINPNENNFVVLHFMGSHENTQNRYPREFAKWGDPDKNEKLIDYDNSIHYTDYVLSQVYDYARAKLNLQVMVYFSDHGAVPDHRRHPDMSGWKHLRVPYVIYTSKEYQELYPEIFATLKAHQKSYISNDLNFELMCGLLDVKASAYQEENSLASPKYKFTKETLTTNLGKKKLAEDKGE